MITSLGEEDPITRAQGEEVERRFEKLRSGRVEGIPAEEVFACIRSHVQ